MDNQHLQQQWEKNLSIIKKRILNQLDDLKKIKIKGKFNGATGNYSSHHITYSNINWPITIKKFIKSLKLDFNSHTTQIEPHDYIADICYKQSHINSILIDFAQDIWSYISKIILIKKILLEKLDLLLCLIKSILLILKMRKVI